ncbi:MAG TPA: cell division protein FtsZ [Opitutaceae bacterium]|nr:cell division protein FtsZ [Opitutaceae bacterium]
MNLNELPLTNELLTDRTIAIKLVGVGGAGSNAVDRLKMENLERLQMAVINTDYQALSSSPVQDKVLIGTSVTRGLGAGGDPELGREAAEADREKIAAVVKGCDLVFLVAGMGGGTGSGASPIVAEIASESGALVIAFVTMPFTFEGGRRLKQAEEGLIALRRCCDAVIPLPNDMLLQEAEEAETALDSFARADEWIGRGVRSIWAMLFRTGLINLDFSTLRQAFYQRGGKTLFGLGAGSGENAATEAIESLKQCPLLHTPEFSRKADRLLVNIVGGTDMTLPRVNEMMTAVTEQFGRDSHVIMGAVIDESMQQRVEICVLGTTDVVGRGVMPRRSPQSGRQKAAVGAAAAGAAGAAAVPASEEVRTNVSVAPQGRNGKSAGAAAIAGGELPLVTHASSKPVAQDEFLFSEHESRGFFDKTDRNLFEGQDLDVPTYLRKGIRIVV